MSVLLKQRLPNSSLNRFSLYEINRVLLAASANVDRALLETVFFTVPNALIWTSANLDSIACAT